MNSMNFFGELIGQNSAVELLEQAVKRNRIASAYLFAGAAGIGRRLATRCFIELLFCHETSPEKYSRIRASLSAGNHPDLLWVEPTYLHSGKRLTVTEAAEAGVSRKAPPQIRIEQIREITEFLSRPPLQASRAVVVLEDAHTMAEAAANALLKTLEEPGRATLILIAPDVDSLLPTLVSRCQRISFYRLSSEQMQQVLQQNGHEEILQDRALLAIAQGSPGEAISAFTRRQAIPQTLLSTLLSPPKTPFEALKLAKEIDKQLDTEAQLWLVNYLQYQYWTQQQKRDLLAPLEKARQSLLSYVQPRLVWECTLINLCQSVA